MNRLSVSISGVELKNPVMPASGTCGFGRELMRWFELDRLGAMVLKGTTLSPRFGNPTPRIAECPEGLLNSVGLQNPGAQAVAEQEIPLLRKYYSGPLIANISGFSPGEYAEAARILEPLVDILEINISCPNVHNGGMSFGTSPDEAEKVTATVKSAVKKPIYMKLTPNVTDITAVARACRDAGADGLTMINTLQGMRLDIKTGMPILKVGMGGLSGPAVLPVAVRMIYQTACAVDIPIIGVGGVSCPEDVIELMSAGASAVQVGSATLKNPMAMVNIIDGLEPLLDRLGVEKISELTGRTVKLWART